MFGGLADCCYIIRTELLGRKRRIMKNIFLRNVKCGENIHQLKKTGTYHLHIIILSLFVSNGLKAPFRFPGGF